MTKNSKKMGLLGKISLSITSIMIMLAVVAVAMNHRSSILIATQAVLFFTAFILSMLSMLGMSPKIERWFDPKTAIKDLQPKLNELERKLEEVDDTENKIEAIIKLFKVISPIQDAGGYRQEIEKLQKRNRKGRFNKEIEAMLILQRHFHNAGRSEYGLNRTTNGEEVTAEKVFLGNVFGLWTKSADYWLSEKTNLEQNFRPDVSKDPNNPVTSWWMINDYQCNGFIRSHIDGIVEQIAVLKAAA